MSYKIASFPDLHMRGQTLAIQIQAMQWCVEKIKDAAVDLVVFPGDVVDSDAVGDRTATPGALRKAFEQTFGQLSLPIILIEGNHDRKGPGRGSALNIFLREGVEAVFHPELRMLPEGSLVCVPWSYTSTPEQTASAVEDLLVEAQPPVILAAHCQVKGAKMNNTRICEAGSFTIPPQLLARFDYLLLGDFHLRQEILPGKGGYGGPLMQQDSGEIGNPVGFEIITIDGNTVTSEWLECPHSIRYQLLEIESIDTPLPVLAPGTIVKVHYPYDDSEEAKALRQKIQAWLPPGSSAVPRIVKQHSQRTQETITDVSHPANVLTFWCKVNNVDEEETIDLHALLEELT